MEHGPLSGSGRRATDATGGTVGEGAATAPFDFQDNAMDLNSIKHKWIDAATATGSAAALEQVRVEALGKKGEITGLMKALGGMTPEERKSFGAALNQTKDEVLAAIEARREALAEADLADRLARDRIDVTLPARPEQPGRLHPISQTIDEIIAIFGE